MEMEKRTLLAIALMVAVFAIYNYVFFSKTVKVQPPGESVEEVEQAENAPASDEVEAEEPEAQAPTEMESDEGAPLSAATTSWGELRQFRVTTPLQEIELSTKGAAITSLKLLPYKGLDGGPVELIPEGGRVLTVSFGGGGDQLSTRDWVFSAEGSDREIGSGESASITFRAGDGNPAIEKTFVFYGDRYDFELRISVLGMPSGGLKRWYRVEWGDGLSVTEEKAAADLAYFRGSALVDESLVTEKLGSFSGEDVKEISRQGRVEWASTQTKYFVAAMVPDGTAEEVIFRGKMVGSKRQPSSGWVGFALEREAASESFQSKFRLFVGPMDYGKLAAFQKGVERTVNMGWGVFRPLSRLVLAALLLGHKWIPNYGVVIILLSVLTKLLFYRLTHKSFTSMHKMQQLQPKLQKLKEKYANDKQKLNEETMKLYRKEKINPLGGCLPLVLQMPVFISLYQVLRSTIELRNAHFMLWITDLSKPEVLFHAGNFPVRLLPIVMGLSMFLQEKFRAKDPRQAAMTYMMPIVMTIILYNFPSGLTLYWLVNNVLTIVQQHYIQRSLELEVP